MPLYEYYCADCGAKFEALRPMDQADHPMPCKQCQSVRTSRALSLFAAVSKGAESVSAVGAGGGCACGGACGCGHH
jgi:putative FmdB family regulatory protein